MNLPHAPVVVVNVLLKSSSTIFSVLIPPRPPFFLCPMSLLYGLCVILLSFFSFVTTVNAFTYTFGTPSQCDSLPLTWTGTHRHFSGLAASDLAMQTQAARRRFL
jgi:hypothetical protein